MYRLFIILLTIISIGCSSQINGVDKDIYNQTEKYATQIYKFTQGEATLQEVDYDDIYNFIQKTDSKEPNEMNDQLGVLYVLMSRYIAEDTETSYPSEKTISQIDEIVSDLESNYSMNIKD